MHKCTCSSVTSSNYVVREVCDFVHHDCEDGDLLLCHTVYYNVVIQNDDM